MAGIVRRTVKGTEISFTDYDGNFDFFNGAVTGSVTISNGIITLPTNAYGSAYGRYTVDTQGGAATDDLDTINGTQLGDLIELRLVSASRVIRVRHAVGNIRLFGGLEFTLNSLSDSLWLRNRNGTVLVSCGQYNVPD